MKNYIQIILLFCISTVCAQKKQTISLWAEKEEESWAIYHEGHDMATWLLLLPHMLKASFVRHSKFFSIQSSL